MDASDTGSVKHKRVVSFSEEILHREFNHDSPPHRKRRVIEVLGDIITRRQRSASQQDLRPSKPSRDDIKSILKDSAFVSLDGMRSQSISIASPTSTQSLDAGSGRKRYASAQSLSLTRIDETNKTTTTEWPTVKPLNYYRKIAAQSKHVDILTLQLERLTHE
jgi:hypothetical protein